MEQNWDDPRFQQTYVGAVKWATGLVDADVTPRPVPGQSGNVQDYGVKSGAVSEELRPQ